LKYGVSSGIAWLKYDSKSVLTVGSAFSLMVREAEVCLINTWRMPVFIWEISGIEDSIFDVIK